MNARPNKPAAQSNIVSPVPTRSCTFFYPRKNCQIPVGFLRAEETFDYAPTTNKKTAEEWQVPNELPSLK